MLGNKRTYAIMAKPSGSVCNLRCSYCYYLGKDILLKKDGEVMSDEVLSQYILQNLRIHGKDAAVEFAWHGGEPTLCGIDFFRRVVCLQKKYGEGRNIINNLQTNGTLIDDDWCSFFRDNNFMIGISIDGPKRLHDTFRKDASGKGSFAGAMNAVSLLKKHGVDYNTLTTVNAANAEFPEELYGFLSGISDYMQFLPVVDGAVQYELTDHSVTAEAYGDFICRIFDIWSGRDIGKKFIQIFEATIGNMLEEPAGVCLHEAVCGHAAVLEANGDLYSCDRYVFDKYKLGNICDEPLSDLMEKNRSFGISKCEGLSEECIDCRWLKLCWGGCPKDRFGPDGKNYLCEGYKKIFARISGSVRFVKH